MSWTRGDSTGNGLADTTTRRDEAEDLEPSLSPAPPRPSAPMPPGGAPLPPGGAPLPPGGAPLPPGGARMPPRGRGGARGGGGRSFAGRRLGRTLSSRSSGSATPGTAPPGPPPSGVRSARPPAPPVQQQLRGCTSPPAQQQQQQQLTLQEEEGEEGEEQTTDSSASEEEDDPGVAIEQSCADLGAASSPTNARYTTDSSDEGSRYGDETGDAGGAGYMRRGDAYHDDDFGGIEALRAELQRVQRRSNAEQSQWEERLRSRDAQVRELEDEIQRARSEIDRLRNRLFEAEPDLMPASRAEELSATLAGTVERLQQENLDLKAQVRAQNSPKSLEDEAEQLIHFSDRVEQGQAELQVVQQELRRVREDNARLRSMVQRGSGPAPVSVDAVVAVSAQVVQRVHSPEPLAPEVTNTIPTSQLQAELEDLRKRNNRMRFQNDQLMQKVRKLEKQCDERSSGWQGDDFPGISGGGGETAWSAFGVAASSRKGCINDDSYGGGADDDDDDDNDSDVEAESAPLRNESDWRGDRSDGGTLSPFQRGNTLSISGLFEPLTELGVYMIKRQNFKCTKSSQWGGLSETVDSYTVSDKRSGEFVAIAVRDKGVGPQGYGPLRFYHEDVSDLLDSSDTKPDTSHDSFFGKLVGKSEARGKSFSLFCCGPQQAGQSPKADVDKDLHMWTKIKWKSVAKVPEPRRIKVRLSEQTRMLRNFCAEKRTMATKLALFDNPVTSRKNFVLMWESQPGVVGGDADANVVELAKVGDDHFQLNVKDVLSPFQSIGVALASIVAEK